MKGRPGVYPARTYTFPDGCRGRLALVGEKDVQVVAGENLAAIEKALKAGGNKDCTVKELPGLNHPFQTCKTGAVSEYARIEETMAPAALETIAEWIVKHTSN